MSVCRDVCVHGNFLGRGIPERGNRFTGAHLTLEYMLPYTQLPQVVFAVLGISSKRFLDE